MALEDTPARAINPTAEEAYWRNAFRNEPYYKADLSYDDYSPAYRVGYTGPVRREGDFTSLEDVLRQDWQQVRGKSRLSWTEARQATRAAWDRATESSSHPR